MSRDTHVCLYSSKELQFGFVWAEEDQSQTEEVPHKETNITGCPGQGLHKR